VLWSPNTQLHYPFQNTALDYSGNARHGTVVGSGVYATKPNAGRCLYFDGTGDYVVTPSFGLSGTVVVFAADVRCKIWFLDYQALYDDGPYSETPGANFLYLLRPTNTNDLILRFFNGPAPQGTVTITNVFLAPGDDIWIPLVVAVDFSGKNVFCYRQGALFASAAMTGTPVFPSTNRVKYLGTYNSTPVYPLTAGYLANVQLWTLATMPPAAQMLANANRLMLGMNPIW